MYVLFGVVDNGKTGGWKCYINTLLYAITRMKKISRMDIPA
jgi:hypothetical protein